jgi:hypothetical protein
MNPFIPGLKNFYFEPDNTTGWPKAVKPGTYVFHFVFDPTSFTIDSFPDSKYTHYLRFNLPIGTSLIDSQTTEQIPLWEWTLTIPDTVLDGYTVEADAGIKRIGASSTATCMIDFAISNPSNSV